MSMSPVGAHEDGIEGGRVIEGVVESLMFGVTEVLSSEASIGSELLFNAQDLVVLGQTLAATGRSSLDLWKTIL
jgi:hypothetical protein